MKKFIKKAIRVISKLLPRSVKKFIRNIFAELAGTREIRDFFRQFYGDYALYEKLLKDKSDVTEYHVDKVIRSVGKQLTELRQENEALKKRISTLEKGRK
jgi:hypothetical protein